MNRLRRSVLKLAAASAGTFAALAGGLLAPLRTLAAQWPVAAFDAKTVEEALSAAGAIDPVTSQEIVIKAPEIAENGAQVPVEITSNLPGTRTIYIFVDKNPQPLAGTFEFMDGAEAFVSTRIKMGETSNLRVVALSGGKFYMSVREVKVTIGGCGE
jgi:sulfur-oxidizing protein SoxY